MRLRPLGFTFALALAPAAFANEPRLIPEQLTLRSYAETHPECTEWGDGCAVCKRNDGLDCSTPGIACQPHEIACVAP